MSEADRKSAWEEFENEKKGLVHTNVGLDNTLAFGAMLQNMLPRGSDGRVMASPINPMAIQVSFPFHATIYILMILLLRNNCDNKTPSCLMKSW